MVTRQATAGLRRGPGQRMGTVVGAFPCPVTKWELFSGTSTKLVPLVCLETISVSHTNYSSVGGNNERGSKALGPFQSLEECFRPTHRISVIGQE